MKFIAKTLYGLENVLAKELESLGAENVEPANRAVIFSGGKGMLYKANYCSRIALSILKPVSEFGIKSKDDLYRKVSEINWKEIMDPDSTFSVVPVISSNIFPHTGYPGLIVKDAIADYFRSKTGRRPSVNTEDPSVLINLHISNERVTVSLDSSVTPLYKRGYRVHQGSAPLNEVLAAGILMLSGWDPSVSLSDPMCGSGTILIEAGLMANRISPGKFRKSFGFEKWKDYDGGLFQSTKEETDKHIIMSGSVISGNDISEIAVDQSLENIRNAGLSDLITISRADFSDLKPSGREGFLAFNPPYGLRLKTGDTGNLYKMIGTALKHNFAGYKAWILTSGKENLYNIGLKPASKFTLYNGALECTLAGFALYEGTKKKTAC